MDTDKILKMVSEKADSYSGDTLLIDKLLYLIVNRLGLTDKEENFCCYLEKDGTMNNTSLDGATYRSFSSVHGLIKAIGTGGYVTGPNDWYELNQSGAFTWDVEDFQSAFDTCYHIVNYDVNEISDDPEECFNLFFENPDQLMQDNVYNEYIAYTEDEELSEEEILEHVKGNIAGGWVIYATLSNIPIGNKWEERCRVDYYQDIIDDLKDSTYTAVREEDANFFLPVQIITCFGGLTDEGGAPPICRYFAEDSIDLRKIAVLKKENPLLTEELDRLYEDITKPITLDVERVEDFSLLTVLKEMAYGKPFYYQEIGSDGILRFAYFGFEADYIVSNPLYLRAVKRFKELSN